MDLALFSFEGVDALSAIDTPVFTGFPARLAELV